MPPKARAAFLADLTEDEAAVLNHDWPFWARPAQLAPPGDWTWWLVLAGRGFGKTRTGAEWIRGEATSGRRGRLALVAPTAADARDVMIEGESGILAISAPWDRPTYEPSKRRLTWPNGAMATLFSAEDPDALRGPQFDGAWCDELAAWKRQEATWDMLQFGMRLGSDPRGIVTTTPRPTAVVKQLVSRDDAVVTRGATRDNAANLAKPFLDTIIRRYEGTRLGRQEIDGEILDDNPDALWARSALDRDRIAPEKMPDLVRIVVGVDPPVTSGEKADECGIVIAGRASDGHGYVLGDHSGRGMKPAQWAEKAVTAYRRFKADCIVVEVNNGGEMVTETIRQVDANVPVRAVHASRGKAIRAEPVSALYEQGRVHHVGTFAVLEDQMAEFTPDFDRGTMGYSPDRVDACLAAGTSVRTRRGDVAIESVRVGDEVLTRAGWREVEWSGQTRAAAQTFDVEFSDGTTLRATAEHPIYVSEKGFVSVDALMWGDTVLPLKSVERATWTSQPKSSSRAGSIAGILTAAGRTLNAISSASLAAASGCITATFGPAHMAPSLAGTTSTIATGIRSTITPTISNASLRQSTASGTPGESTGNGRGTGSIPSGTSRLSGIAPKLAAHGIEPTASARGSTGRGTMFGPASAAESASARSVPTPLIARPHAIAESLTEIMRMSGRFLARFVGRLSGRASIGPSRRHAPVSVVRVSAANVEPVFNLHVKGDANEFFANGVLVHNCVWALTDLMLGHHAEPSIRTF